MDETKEEFSKRIWDGGESDNVPQVNALVEIAWQLDRIYDLMIQVAEKKKTEIDPYAQEPSGVEMEEK